jgi:hypothetical protein
LDELQKENEKSFVKMMEEKHEADQKAWKTATEYTCPHCGNTQKNPGHYVFGFDDEESEKSLFWCQECACVLMTEAYYKEHGHLRPRGVHSESEIRELASRGGAYFKDDFPELYGALYPSVHTA